MGHIDKGQRATFPAERAFFRGVLSGSAHHAREASSSQEEGRTGWEDHGAIFRSVGGRGSVTRGTWAARRQTGAHGCTGRCGGPERVRATKLVLAAFAEEFTELG